LLIIGIGRDLIDMRRIEKDARGARRVRVGTAFARVSMRVVPVVLGLVSLASSAAAAEPCTLRRLVSVDSNVDDNQLYIPAQLQGRATNLMVDTGGAWSLIKSDLVDELKLEKKINHGMDFVDAAGKKMPHYVRVTDFKLGNLAFNGPVDFIVMTGYRGLDRWGGTIGLNIIARFDVELDNAAKRVNLFHPKHCRNMSAYWADEYVDLPLINVDGLPETKLDIDGEEVRALIDTGSSHTFMDIDLARRKFGITPQSQGVVPSSDLTLPSGKVVKTYTYTFKTLTLSGFRFSDVEVILDDGDGSLTLGTSELKHLHLYFAFKEARLYATLADERR
jgi:predicted aspartyl protease